MNRKISYLIIAFIGTLPTVAVGITSYPVNPGFGAPSYSQAQMDEAYANGKAVGHREGGAECIANPTTCGCNNNPALTPCGISLNSMLTGARYGETEPNENIISADPMVPSAIYWGQSMSYQDQDWFYVTTEEPNQIVNLNLRATPLSICTSTPAESNVKGWDVSIRDAAGNVLAQFAYNFQLQKHNVTLSPTDSTCSSYGVTSRDVYEEISVPTFVAYPGTYYVVIKTLGIGASPTSVNWTPLPYNLISSISFSDSDTPPIDVNFFDVETEPNDDFATADPLVSTVTMFAMLHTTLAGNATNGWNLQSENDWFWYTSPGNEIATIAWCQREYCAPQDGYSWRVTIKLRDGTLIGSFDTQSIRNDLCIMGDHLDLCIFDGGSETLSPTPYNTLYFGLEEAGDYFIQVQSTLLINPDTGEIITRCREWSTPQPGQTAVCLSLAPVSTTTTAQYNFTWHGTRRPPNTYDP